MKPPADHDLIAFAHGDLGMRRRLDVRLRLALSRAAKARLRELQTATDAIAGAYSTGGAAGFRANVALRLRRLLIIDVVVGCAVLSALAGGAAIAVRVVRGPNEPAAGDACPPSTTTAKPNGTMQAVTVHRAKRNATAAN